VRYTGPALTGGSARDYRLRFKVVGEPRAAIVTLPVKVVALD
jgi:hypothetical protein